MTNPEPPMEKIGVIRKGVTLPEHVVDEKSAAAEELEACPKKRLADAVRQNASQP